MKNFFCALLFALSINLSIQAQHGHKPSNNKLLFHGTVKTVVYDDEYGTEKHFLDTGKRLIPLSFKNGDLLNSKVSIKGRLNGAGVIIPDEIKILEKPQDSSNIATSGSRRILVLLLNFTNDTSEPISTEQARSKIFTISKSTNAYFQQVSGGQLKIVGQQREDGDILGWLTLPFTNENCLNLLHTEWTAAADNLAALNGVNVNSYQSVVYAFRHAPGCANLFAGRATTG